MISGKSTLKLIDVTTGIPEDTIKYGVAFHECIDADGNSYKVVKIGDQTWMDENLKTTKFNDGTAIPYTKDNSVWSASVLASTPAYCWYSDDTYQNAYGALYNWYAVNTGKLAPVGWHVATDDEWTILGNYLMANGYNYDGTTTSNKYAKSLATTYSLFFQQVALVMIYQRTTQPGSMLFRVAIVTAVVEFTILINPHFGGLLRRTVRGGSAGTDPYSITPLKCTETAMSYQLVCLSVV